MCVSSFSYAVLLDYELHRMEAFVCSGHSWYARPLEEYPMYCGCMLSLSVVSHSLRPHGL